MSWVQINMKFASVCMICKKRLRAGEPGLWAKGVGVKHVQCAQESGATCIMCGSPAGCQQCSVSEDCDYKNVSLCICSNCEGTITIAKYGMAAEKKFHALSSGKG